jgi:hypothetical protein
LLCLGDDNFFCACWIEVVVTKMSCSYCAIRKSWFAGEVTPAHVVSQSFMLLILDYDSGCVPVVCFGLSHANVKTVV